MVYQTKNVSSIYWCLVKLWITIKELTLWSAEWQLQWGSPTGLTRVESTRSQVLGSERGCSRSNWIEIWNKKNKTDKIKLIFTSEFEESGRKGWGSYGSGSSTLWTCLYKCFGFLGEVRLLSQGEHLPAGDPVRPHITLVRKLALLDAFNSIPGRAHAGESTMMWKKVINIWCNFFVLLKIWNQVKGWTSSVTAASEHLKYSRDEGCWKKQYLKTLNT